MKPSELIFGETYTDGKTKRRLTRPGQTSTLIRYVPIVDHEHAVGEVAVQRTTFARWAKLRVLE